MKELEERLEDWALWARGPEPGGAGEAIGYLREKSDRAVDSAELTDDILHVERAVARARIKDKAYWRVISRYYLGRMSEIEIAGFFGVSESNIKTLLEEAKSEVRQNLFLTDCIESERW